MIPTGWPLMPHSPTATDHQTSPQPDQPNSIKLDSPIRLTILDSKTNEKKHFAFKSWTPTKFSAGAKRPERLAVITRIKSNAISRHSHESVQPRRRFPPQIKFTRHSPRINNYLPTDTGGALWTGSHPGRKERTFWEKAWTLKAQTVPHS